MTKDEATKIMIDITLKRAPHSRNVILAAKAVLEPAAGPRPVNPKDERRRSEFLDEQERLRNEQRDKSQPIDGWGEDPKKVEAVIKDDSEVLAMYREAMKHQGERTDFRNNITEVEVATGNSKSYTPQVEPQVVRRVSNR